jgi:hypothetical protein
MTIRVIINRTFNHVLQNHHLSRWTILFIILICGWYGINLDTWGKNKIIQNDVVSYYAYLPAAFIFNDLGFEFIKDLPDDFEGTIWLQTAPSGKPVLKMTMGLAILWTPFFLIANIIAQISGSSALGYSWPYSLSIFIATLVYLMVGLVFLRKLLLRYFSEVVSASVMLILVLGTNLMYYVVSEPGMSHVYNFCLITAFLYYTIKWTEKPGLKYSLVLGVIGGLIVLIRPVNILVIIFPLLVGIRSWHQLTNRIITYWRFILAAAGLAFLMVLPQLIYWKMQTGHIIFNSYLEEGFFFQKPEIIHGLFSYRKGWLLYTPVMALSVTGFIWMRQKASELFYPILLFTALFVYVVYSWWCWWYGGSFGSRPMIDIYGVMAIPMAACLDKAGRSKKWIIGLVAFLILAMISLNQFQMKQYRSSLLHWDSMTKEAYWGIFGKTRWPEGYDQMIKTPDYEKALQGKKEYP